MNVIAITGRLTETPELKTTTDNKPVCDFRVAVPRPHKKDVTDFFTCVAWNKNAEFITRFFRKGQKIEINGMLVTRSYEKEGKKHTLTEILCETVNFGESKQAFDNSQDTAPSFTNIDEADFSTSPIFDEDVLPF